MNSSHIAAATDAIRLRRRLLGHLIGKKNELVANSLSFNENKTTAYQLHDNQYKIQYRAPMGKVMGSSPGGLAAGRPNWLEGPGSATRPPLGLRGDAFPQHGGTGRSTEAGGGGE